MEYQVWSEGFRSTGQSGSAHNHGTFDGDTFKDAVESFRTSLADQYSRDCVNLESLTFWGCRFFDNEGDARKSFG